MIKETKTCKTCAQEPEQNYLFNSGLCAKCDAREVYAVTRAMNLPRAALYVPFEKPPKGKNIALNQAAKRMETLRKKYPSLSTFEAQRFELQALLAAATRPLAA